MTEKVKVHEIAKELGITSKDVVKKALDMGIEVKSANSSVTLAQAEKLADFIIKGEQAVETPVSKPPKQVKKKSDTLDQKDTPKKDVIANEVQVIAQEVKVETPKKEEETPKVASQKIEVIEKSRDEDKLYKTVKKMLQHYSYHSFNWSRTEDRVCRWKFITN